MIRIRIHLVLSIRVKLIAAPHTSVSTAGVLHVGEVEGPGDGGHGWRGQGLLGLTVTLAFPQEHDAEDDEADEGGAANCPADYGADVVGVGWRGGGFG